MLLSIDHPEIVRHLKTLGYGLQPVFDPARRRHFLVVKATKEMILTARSNREFKVYLLGDGEGAASHLGFVTAFFDDPDEPLTVRSPQFGSDDFLRDLTGVLMQPEFEVYFFDEHDREMFGVRATNLDAERFRTEIAQATFAAFDQTALMGVLRRLDRRFAVRDAQDDANAFAIRLGENLYPDDYMFIDARDEAYGFHGADRTPAVTSLEREEPGSFQERDIAVMLGRVFDGASIFLNPIRDDTGKELTDVLVHDDGIAIFIQAKDSPNTEATLRRSIDRKRSAIRAHIHKASKQLKGAMGHAQRNGALVLRTDDGSVSLPLGDHLMIGLVVVREMFDDDYSECSAPVLAAVRGLDLPAVLVDYSGLHIMAQNLRPRGRFVGGLLRLFEKAVEKGEFPKPVYLGPPAEG